MEKSARLNLKSGGLFNIFDVKQSVAEVLRFSRCPKCLNEGSMATKKKRINLVVGDETWGQLEELAGKQGKSLASTSLALIEQALELLEDKHFSAEADARMTKKQKRVSSAKAWS